jgi:hypothetical protein
MNQIKRVSNSSKRDFLAPIYDSLILNSQPVYQIHNIFLRTIVVDSAWHSHLYFDSKTHQTIAFEASHHLG